MSCSNLQPGKQCIMTQPGKQCIMTQPQDHFTCHAMPSVWPSATVPSPGWAAALCGSDPAFPGTAGPCQPQRLPAETWGQLACPGSLPFVWMPGACPAQHAVNSLPPTSLSNSPPPKSCRHIFPLVWPSVCIFHQLKVQVLSHRSLRTAHTEFTWVNTTQNSHREQHTQNSHR